MEQALIFTSKGNIPLAGLEHNVDWTITDERIVFVESYLLEGEVVKQSSHVKLLIGATSIGDTSI